MEREMGGAYKEERQETAPTRSPSTADGPRLDTMLEVRGVSKAFAGTSALEDVSFSVARGEILCLLGPSGCGKTTLLRIIAGLEYADRGQILLEGADLRGKPVHQRDLGLMFQEYALFPHKDVYGNVAFGLRMARLRRAEIKRRVSEALALVGLTGFEDRAVHELSGGEQQRVALARSLAPRPRLLMLDEPLGSLDRALRERLMNELRQIIKPVGVTTVYVTHDQSEAFALGDRVAVMQQGCIEQIGPPEEVYRHPVSPFVARFLGMNNLLTGYTLDAEASRVETPLGEIQIQRTTRNRLGDQQERRPLAEQREHYTPHAKGTQVIVLLRPEAARVVNGLEEQVNLVRVRVVQRSFRGSRFQLMVRHESGTELTFELEYANDDIPSVGDVVQLSLQPQGINLLAKDDERETQREGRHGRKSA
jgi:ABC-type Fe3+/spermidine/putrescine transport system ATPase subunit